MAHRSNQAVASQDQAPPQPEEPPRPRRLLVGWATALAALGVSSILLAAGLWIVRRPIAEFMIGAMLAERGVEADFRVTRLGFGGATLSNIRFGSETSPDALAPTIEARWDWAGVVPRLRFVRVMSPELRLRMDGAGRVSAGTLDRLGSAGPARRRPAIPAIMLEIVEGELTIDGPFGMVNGVFSGAGTLGRNFSGIAQIAETSRPGEAYALDHVAAELIVVSREQSLAFRFSGAARGVVWAGARLEGPAVRIMGRTPLDLSRYDIDAAWRVAALDMPDLRGEALSGVVGAEALTREDSLAPTDWQGGAQARAATLTYADMNVSQLRVELRTNGSGPIGRGSWTLAADRFDGLALVSEQANADGAFSFELRGDETMQGQARLMLARARLDAEAQQRIRDAFPDLGGAPVGPTFASAERALDAAADRFDLAIPLAFDGDESGVRIRVAAPVTARSATGATVQLSALRNDTPALVLQWPGPMLHGALALELSGGGAPQASLLLDSADWAPNAPFEADGTLSLSNWRAEGASIGADELDISIAIPPNEGGRVAIAGPARITGPLGEGEVRDLVTALDLGVAWDAQGWRVVPDGCLASRLGGLDAAGLSFANGAFSLCPLHTALIAADAQRNLSGGFVIRRLALNGRMAGPQAQPARLSAQDVTGRFSGRTGDMTLALEADAPRLAITMAEDRTLAVSLVRVTADARINESWRVEGAFERGALTDPSLPGSVSAIAGRWSAAPEPNAEGNEEPVIRVTAGEALLTANRPASDAERPLFNPLRLVETNAVVRGGQINVDGAIVLEARDRQLARFTASHAIDAGEGAAQVVAADIQFGPTLQPYDITERMRGLVDNVRGGAGVVADITWNREAIAAVGHLRLDGVSLATATIPTVENVRGEIFFDDLFALTTPPGQLVDVGLLNPGVAVHDGRVQFQLLPDQRVAIEQANFAFAGGTLSMEPTMITLGAEETRFALSLREVDAAALLATLNVPDVQMTGRVEGAFPLLLTRRTAYIENGVLRALPGGGTIAYTGDAGANATGSARIAFDALRSFRYDQLELTLNGDLSDEVVTAIEFSGVNSGEPVDLGPIAPVPGLGRVTVRGVPFEFNVHVTAPFRRLAQTAASITDPGAILDRSRQSEPTEPVDQEPRPPG
jgi:hypothetical protein